MVSQEGGVQRPIWVRSGHLLSNDPYGSGVAICSIGLIFRKQPFGHLPGDDRLSAISDRQKSCDMFLGYGNTAKNCPPHQTVIELSISMVHEKNFPRER